MDHDCHRSTAVALQPLAGVRVADFSSNMAGPYGAMILAQLGADVIKVEPPQGDDARAWPPFAGGMSLAHRHVGAGKRGIVVCNGIVVMSSAWSPATVPFVPAESVRV